MAIPAATKIPLLRTFHKHIYDPYVMYLLYMLLFFAIE